MAKVIKDLRIDEISLVDSPANPGARVLLHKRNATRKMECECGEEDEMEEGAEPVEMRCRKCGKPMKLAKAMPNAGDLHVDNPLSEDDEDDLEVSKGDLPGHEFRGNQWTTGGGDGRGEYERPSMSEDKVMTAFHTLNRATAKEQEKYHAELSRAKTEDDRKKADWRFQSAMGLHRAKYDQVVIEEKHKTKTQKAASPAEGGSMTEEVTKLQAELDAVKKSNAELIAKVEAFENSPEQIAKRQLEAVPEPIRKRLQAAEEALAKMAEDKREAEVVTKCADVPGAKDLVPVLKKLGSEDLDVVLKALKALTEQVKTGEIFKVAGADGGAAPIVGEASDIMKRAEVIMKEEKVDVGAALARIFAQDPRAYDEYRRAVSVAR